ncbi:unnamed protein product [Zymoseptoria tritici ST99CH_1A5]|uniref:Uncharacterized protein n=2 Tax=Zymoseptoria tritici TaxID=1047171 RepID=A0A2H1GPX2_ZYMTR|nr:unnamed protein product [Zymoseptoria tritici ST99CH_1E4]SMR57918.1 unnamed protein product [Zymoseptoria tritici ST99CH_3D1]SMY26350.1 unnamed protein product [Zymoseptoria tritici ST99CH_1A5]
MAGTKRNQEEAELECESSAPMKKPSCGFALPSTTPLAHRPLNGRPRFLPKAVLPPVRPKKANPPNSFDPKSFVLHKCAKAPKEDQEMDEGSDSELEDYENLVRMLDADGDYDPPPRRSKSGKSQAFVVKPMATSLPAKTILAVPTVAHTATNPFLEPAMTVADFGDYIAEYVFDAHKYIEAWTQLTPGQFAILVHDPFHRNKMIEFHTEFMNIEQVLLDGRKDWDLASLPYEFFESVMQPLRKTGDLAMKLSENRVCEWMSVAARSCSESWRLLRKAEEAKEDVEQWPAVWEHGMMV